MSKHTPGPWQHSVRLSASENHRGFSIWTADGWALADVQPADENGIEGEANARLIAAAPMMLELLKRLLPIAEDAAESLGRFCSDEGWAQEDMDRMDNVDGMLPLMRAAIKAAEGEGA